MSANYKFKQKEVGYMELNERKKGRSQVVQADSSQYIAQIPNSETQPSYTSASFVVALSLEPVSPRKGDEYDYMSVQLAEMLLNPITATKRYDDAKSILKTFMK